MLDTSKTTQAAPLTEGMSLEELIGQVLMFGFEGTTVPAHFAELLRTNHIGNVIFFARNVHDVEQIQALTAELQRIAQEAGQRYPLLISIDQENGMVRRFGDSTTTFPGNMALGAIGSEEMARAIATATGRELRALGINMNLAPVVDINNNPLNPVIGVRSFGEDPQMVGRLGVAMLEGYRDAGVVTCLKHFPGHGDTAVDSHEALPSIPYEQERLDAIELIPFKQGIAAGADSIMVAHLALPALITDSSLPASLSPEIIRNLLRQQLGYQGMIITDCLEMNAVSETLGTESGALRALQAGADIALVSHTYQRQLGSIQAIKAALEAGTLSLETIREAAEHVLQLKARLPSWEDQTAPATDVIGSAAHQQLRDQAYEQAITVVKNEQQLIPLHINADQRLLVLFSEMGSQTQAVDAFQPEEALLSCLKKHYPQLTSYTVLRTANEHEQAQFQQRLAEADIILVVTINASLDPFQAEVMQQVLRTGKATIGLAIYNPYDLLAFPELKTYLVTYEVTEPALQAAARVISGDIVALGKLPVSLAQ
ncbi:beta-N-acetylhexosaminidase [Tengunoibacter tsumagoiensis]|uniref:Beta-glucosidase n=1 Tax=Tengunoibacter tsumagoiensis TaxID=2014871 RepID=A0A402A6W2_9CHLR|nr:beta-N-acetylhexosaminidase [Tengunoibacter tsumagoiensis]GCE14731.1 beta-glucosidase [Tengunoibacter tsumagoiensis]